MTRRQRLVVVGKHAAPLMMSMLASNILNLVDTIMVSRLGEASIGGVALSFNLVFLTFAVLMGMGPAVQAQIARRVGEGNLDQVGAGVAAGQVLSVAVGLPFSLMLFFGADLLMGMVGNDPVVAAEGLPYLRIMAFTVPAVGLNATYSGLFNGIGRPVYYMVSVVAMVILNIFLNYVLIFGNLGAPALGTFGAGLASMLSLYAAVAFSSLISLRLRERYHVWGDRPRRTHVVSLMRFAFSTGLQRLIVGFSFTVFYKFVGMIGTVELAISAVIMRLVNLIGMPMMAIGMAGAAIVGRTLGRGEREEASRWGYDSLICGMLLLPVLCFPLVAFPQWVIGIFLKDPATMAAAVWPLRLTALTINFSGLSVILMLCLYGAGDQKYVLRVSSALNFCVFLPLTYLLGPTLKYGVIGAWSAFGLHFLLLTVAYAWRWRSGTQFKRV